MSTKGTERLIAEQLGLAFGELGAAFADADAAILTLRRLGWIFDQVPQVYLDLATQAEAIVAKVQASQGSASDDASLIKSIFDLIGPLYTALKTLPAPVNVDSSVFLAEMPESLVSLFLGDYLSVHLPTLYHALVQLGVIQTIFHPEVQAADGSISRPARVERAIVYSEIPALLSNPAGIPQRAFGWGTTDFDFDLVARPLAELLSAAGLQAFVEGMSPDLAELFLPQPTPGNNIKTFIRVSFLDTLLAGVPVSLAVGIFDAPVEPTHPLPGISVQPLLPSLNQQIQIGTNTVLAVTGGVDLENSFGLFIRPKETPELRFPFVAGSGIPAAGVSTQITFTPPSASVLLGSSDGTRLEATGATLGVGVAENNGAIEAKAEASSALRVVVKPGDGDGFIGTLLGSAGGDGLDAKFNAGFRWSNLTGFSLIAAGGFELKLAPNLSLGPLTLQTLNVSVKGGTSGGPPAIVASVGAGVAASLGPIGVVVDDVGVSVDFQFVEGNAGRFNFDVGFKPPNGVGISVSGGPVSGGGFIAFDPDAGRYSGALALQVYSVAVKAFGVIDTKLPSGGPAFSFFIIISAEFQPIQLGFGFTLLGVGGLLGINRGLDATALEAAVKAGSIDNILFPKNPIKDAPTILADVESIFPATPGTYAFGPLARIGWGTPAIIDARVGIVLIFPGTKIALLGVVTALLPPGASKALALVEIHMDIDGLLDFPKKHFEMDAELHDSQVRGFPISGEMAARMDWGTNPNFAVSLGGFNPHYTPPTGFPTLRRLSIDLGIKGNPSATLQGYMALTSNTAQVGAALDVSAHAGGANLSGGLAFDALFVFSPFSFDASLSGGVHVDFHGVGFGMHFDGDISGPAPWHLHGDVSVSVLWFSASVGFDLTLGGESKPELPAIDIWAGSTPDSNGNQDVPGLQSAVVAPGNWTGVLPPNGYQVVSITQNDSTASRVDPLGKATFQQKVVPFALSISKFAGRTRAKNDVTKISVQTLTVNGVAVPATQIVPVQDLFAPVQYQNVPDSQALSSPSYQQFQGGFSFSSDDIVFGTEQTQAITMETVLIGTSATPQPYSIPSDATMQAMTARSAAGTGGLRTSNIDRFVDLTATLPFALATEVYALVLKTTLARFSGNATTDSAYALQADQLAALTPDVRATLQIVPAHEIPA